MTRDINELLPIVKQKAQALIDACKAQGIALVITGTYRSSAEQDAVYLQGRTTPGAIVTNAKGGQSFHNWRVAFDCVPIVNNVAVYDNDVLWGKIVKLGIDLGLEWGGSWDTFPDKPHFQYTLGYSWQDFQSNKVDIKKFDLVVAPPPMTKDQIKGEISRLVNLL